MLETQELQALEGKFSERDPAYPGIRFEPGIHPTTSKELDALEARFAAGDLSAHGWNKEVLSRMKKYSPEVIAIDGLYPSLPQGDLFPQNLWLYLPGKPSEINPLGKEVYVVRGDLEGTMIKDTEVNTGGGGIIYAESLASFVLGIFTSQIMKAPRVQAFFEKKVSRRRFLKLATAGVGGLLVTKATEPLLSILAAKSSSQSVTDFLLDFVEIFGRRISNQESIDGRTALLIAKEEDAIDFLGKPKETPGTIIMGSAHSPEAMRLIKDGKAREKIISHFTGVLLETSEQAVEKCQFVDSSDLAKKERRTDLLDYIARTEIIRVTDPLVFPDGNLRQIAMVIGIFQSPQVEKAIEKFR